ncbi:MAG: helix-turn-helix transcriptional regulator [Hyphomonas sp.]|nr:helix-turn-helix transcriptional regulator [Hyphomonas sp.]
MLFFDSILRFPAATLLFILAILALRDARQLVQGRIVVILSLTLGAMLISTAPPETRPPSPLYETLRIFDVANIVFVWWFTLSLFEDDFRLRRLHWGVLGLYILISLPLRIEFLLGYSNAIPFIVDVMGRVVAVGMVTHMFWTALSGLKDDLIESRRRTRLWYVTATALATSLIILGETWYTTITGDHSDPPFMSFLRSAIILPPVFAGAYLYLAFRSEALLFQPVAQPRPPAVSVSPKDQATHARLVAAMEDEHLYREHGLGIGDLADKLSVPEHQLRALINKGLGYRNFAAFLNQYRLAEAKRALADPEQARTPILTIAMDVGYASLATFNRAFKSEEGMTPSQFRSEALAKAAQS